MSAGKPFAFDTDNSTRHGGSVRPDFKCSLDVHWPADCMFEHLKRVKKTTRKIESVDDMSGYALLDDDEKKLLQELVAKRNEPKKKVPRSPKAAKPTASGGAAATTAASPVVAVVQQAPFTVRTIAVPGTSGTDESGAVKPMHVSRTLHAGTHAFGRGDSTGVREKNVSRQQVQLIIDGLERYT